MNESPPAIESAAASEAPLHGELQRWMESVRLAQAGLGQGNAEGIHDFRVSLRRLRSVMGTVVVAWGRRKVKRLATELRLVASATGELRDEEVLRETLLELSLSEEARAELTRWMRGRARRERGLRARVEKRMGKSKRLARSLRSLAKVLARPGRPKRSTAEVAQNAIEIAFAALDGRVQLARSTGRESEPLHRTRIAAKKLRYTCDLLGRAGYAGLGEVKLATTVLQKRLGRIQDIAQATLRIERALGLEPSVRQEVLEALGEEADIAYKRARRLLDGSKTAGLRARISQFCDRPPRLKQAKEGAKRADVGPPRADEA